MSAYQEGKDAYWDGFWHDQNPYPIGSTEEADWDEGWFAARACDEDDPDWED
jgi:hypothetical protein